MESLRMQRRLRIVLATITGVLAIGLFVSAISVPDATPQLRSNALRVYPREGGCGSVVGSSKVAAVDRALASELVTADGEVRTTDLVREALLETYGDQVTESVTAMYYVREWDPIWEEFVWKCVSASEFEIAFGNESPIVVESLDTLLMD